VDKSTYQWTLQSICVLYRVVAMIPRGSILSSLKAVRVVLTRRDRTLSNAVDTVHIHRLILSNPVPVNAGAILFHTIDYSDIKGLSTSEFEIQIAELPDIALTSPQHASSQGPGYNSLNSLALVNGWPSALIDPSVIFKL